jgi:hypothetical protein
MESREADSVLGGKDGKKMDYSSPKSEDADAPLSQIWDTGLPSKGPSRQRRIADLPQFPTGCLGLSRFPS